MAWLESEPAPVLISVETYFESRPNPDRSGRLQLRKRSTVNNEYRGVSKDQAFNMCQFFPLVSLNDTITRTARPIGGGGYTITQSRDRAIGEWENAPEEIGIAEE
jgi:hypothetical protein